MHRSSLLVFIFASLLLAARGTCSAPLADGPTLYREYCSACHGSDGHGGVGVPLALPSFLSSVDDRYLAQTIRHGRPGRVMPSFSQLTDHEVAAIVAHLRSWPGAAGPKELKPDRISGNPTKGAILFQSRCAACHGPHGEGGHGTGVTFSRPRNAPILAPALNNPGFLDSASDTMIKNALMRGREGTPMQSFLKQGLNEKDINNIVAYVRSFRKIAPAATIPAPAREPPILVRESPYPFDQTLDKVKTAIGAANMRLIRVQTLDQGFVPEGKENPDQTIVYSCDFNFLNEALKVDPRVGLFLPCRVTVVKQKDRVLVMTINPKRLSRVFNNTELDQMCDRMRDVYTSILEEVVL